MMFVCGAMAVSVGNVSMFSENPKVCQDFGSCLQGVKILCKINGQTASTYQWAICYNGTVSPLNASESFSTQYVGQQTILCTAIKRIANTFYSGSANFTTNGKIVFALAIVYDRIDINIASVALKAEY